MPSTEELNRWARAVAECGDRQAFALLFEHYAPRVKSYLMHRGCNETLADELTQGTMVTVWRKSSMFDPQRSCISTWIYTVARNLGVDHHRRLHGEVGAERADDELAAQADPGAGPDEQVDMLRNEQRMRAALARLSPEHQLLLRLAYYDDKTHAQIASERGIPLGTIKTRIRAALKQLRTLIDAPA